MPDLSVEYLGLKLKNPLIVASSGLTRNAKLIQQCEAFGAGAVVMKSIFEEDIRRRDNTFEDFLISHPEAAGYFDAQIGLIYGAQQYCDEIRKTKDLVGIPVIASINCAEPRWWLDYATQLEAAGADALEINLAVPSVELDLSGEHCEATFYEIISAVISHVRIPIAVKMSGQLTAPQNVARKMARSGARALVVFNRQSSLDIDIQKKYAYTSKGDQGLSSPHNLYYPLRWVSILRRLLPGVELSASGGVHDGEAFIKYILAGATTVQVCSLFYRKGLSQIAVLLEEFEAYLKSQGAGKVADIRGAVSLDLPVGSREQQRLEYLQLTKGHYLEVDATDGGGLIYESHLKDPA